MDNKIPPDWLPVRGHGLPDNTYPAESMPAGAPGESPGTSGGSAPVNPSVPVWATGEAGGADFYNTPDKSGNIAKMPGSGHGEVFHALDDGVPPGGSPNAPGAGTTSMEPGQNAGSAMERGLAGQSFVYPGFGPGPGTPGAGLAGESTPPASGAPPEVMQLAGLGARFWAYIFDIILLLLFNGSIMAVMPPDSTATSLFDNFAAVNVAFLGVTGLAYFALMTGWKGQTLGKMLMGIKVVQKSGGKMDWKTVVFREVLGRTISQMVGLHLGYLVGFFTGRNQTLHDIFADTYVVRETFYFDRFFVTIPAKD